MTGIGRIVWGNRLEKFFKAKIIRNNTETIRKRKDLLETLYLNLEKNT